MADLPIPVLASVTPNIYVLRTGGALTLHIVRPELSILSHLTDEEAVGLALALSDQVAAARAESAAP